jgi:PAS domain S-box-containing protein
VLVNSIDFDNLLLRNEAFISPGHSVESITALLGYSPLHKVFKINRTILRLVKGSFFKFEHGLHHLTFKTVPKKTAWQIEDLVDSGDMYAIAFAVENILYGAAALILPKNIQLKHAGTLETFIRQAAVTIRSIQAERNEEKYRSMFEFMSQGAFYQTADGINTDVNDAALNILGISREDFLNKKYITNDWHFIDENLNLLSPDNLTPNLALRSGSPVRNRVIGVYNPEKKKYAWIISNAIPIFLPGQSKPHRVFATLQDITAIRSAEDKLSKSVAELEQLHNIISHSPTFVVSWKVQPDKWPVLFITQNVERLLGYKAEDFTNGRVNWSDIIHPEDQETVDNTTLRNVKEGVKEWALEYRLISSEGQVMWFRDQNVALKNANGEIVQIQSVVTDITATKKSEKELNHAQARAAALLEAMPDLMFRLDKNGVYLDYKASNDDLFVRDQNIIGKNLCDLVPENLANETTARIHKTLLTNTIQEYEYSLDIPAKGIQHFEARMISSGRDEVTTIVRNITARKKREREFRDLVENAPVGIYRTSPEGLLLMANPALIRMLGYESFEDLKSESLQFEGYEYSFTRQIFLDNILRDGQVHAMEASWKTKDGSSIIVSESARIVRDDMGELLYFEGMVIDITERKKAGALIRENEANLKAIIENSPDSIWSINRNYEIQYVNQRFAEDYKKVFGAVLAKGVNKLRTLPADLQPLWKERYDRALKNESFQIVDEVGTPTGSIFIEVTANPIVIEGTVTGVALSGRDITDRMKAEDTLKKSEASLRELNGTKDKFFSIIAHDLRSPFNSILGFSTMLSDEAAEMDLDQIKNYSSIIKNSATQTLQLLDNLLEWARLQQGKLILNPRLLVLKETVRDVTDTLRANARQKNITVLNEVPANIIVHADEDMLNTVIRNLLSNAIKFTPREGRVALTATTKDGFAELRVTDNGIGISPENILKLFDAASDFTMRGTAHEKGTGLGLMLCKEFIELHHGDIKVQSEPGKGSSFIVAIPIQDNNSLNT